jgi:hypothetical protein
MTMRELKATVLPALLAGARAREAAASIDITDPLQALSLTGQALRFDRPPQPATFMVEEKIVDPRPFLPHKTRLLLLRVLAGRSQTPLAAAVARALTAANVRLYSFHLTMLDQFVQAHAETLGPEAMAFAQREAPAEQKQGYFSPDQLTDETWMLATPAVKATYLAKRRATDPATAVALLEAIWGTENADVRLRLLGTLRTGLSEADAPFLNGLAKDRAPRVRELAQRLLARLPGFSGDDSALRAVLERIKAGKSGLVFKKATLTLEVPATIQQFDIPGWVGETFAGVDFSSLGKALSMTLEEMIDAAQKDAPMLLACLMMATEVKRIDLVGKAVSHARNAWADIMASGLDDLPGYGREERMRWADRVVQAGNWSEATSLWSLPKLLGLLDGSASAQLMRELLSSKAWITMRTDPARLTSDVVENLAVLCPPSMRPALRSEIAEFDGKINDNANLFLDLMDILEAQNA